MYCYGKYVDVFPIYEAISLVNGNSELVKELLYSENGLHLTKFQKLKFIFNDSIIVSGVAHLVSVCHSSPFDGKRVLSKSVPLRANAHTYDGDGRL